MNCVKKGRVSLVVPMAIALPRVHTKASTRRMVSRTDTPLPIPVAGTFNAAVTSRADPAFILDDQWWEVSMLTR